MRSVASLGLLLALAACGYVGGLYGAYRMDGAGGVHEPNAPNGIWLTLRRSGRYEFCVERCSHGRFETYPSSERTGRIRFYGEHFADFAERHGATRQEETGEGPNIEIPYEIGITASFLYLDYETAWFRKP